jgi:hypothetical protein
MAIMYCVKCKQKTQTKDISESVSKNKRKMLKGVCIVCGSKKSTFVKGSSTGEGIVADVVGKIPFIGNFLQIGLEKLGLGIEDHHKFKDACLCKGVDLSKFERKYHGGILPLIPIIAAVLGGLGGLGGLAGGVASAVNSSKSAAEQERHNREIEAQIKGAGLRLTPGSGIFLGPWQQ